MKFLFTSLVLHLRLFLLLFNLVKPNYGEKYGGLHPPSLAQFQNMVVENKWTDCLKWATIVTHDPESLKDRYAIWRYAIWKYKRYGHYLHHFLF